MGWWLAGVVQNSLPSLLTIGSVSWSWFSGHMVRWSSLSSSLLWLVYSDTTCQTIQSCYEATRSQGRLGEGWGQITSVGGWSSKWLVNRRKVRSQTSDNIRTDGTGEVARVREGKKKEDQRRERVGRRKMQVRKKVEKSRNAVFLQCLVPPKGRKVG